MTSRLTVALMIALATPLRAEGIQKWRTPDGSLYFGDKPPTGSTKIGEERSNEPPSTGFREPASGSADERLSIDSSRARAELEKALHQTSERLEEVRKKIDEARRQPDVVPGWMEKRAHIQNEKAETLRELRLEERKTLAAVVVIWRRFETLDARVKRQYGGEAPDWWLSTLSCPGCPSRTEAEAALR